jgi:hypothetical protein
MFLKLYPLPQCQGRRAVFCSLLPYSANQKVDLLYCDGHCLLLQVWYTPEDERRTTFQYMYITIYIPQRVYSDQLNPLAPYIQVYSTCSVILNMPNVRWRWQPLIVLFVQMSFKFQSPAHHTGHLILVWKDSCWFNTPVAHSVCWRNRVFQNMLNLQYFRGGFILNVSLNSLCW